MHTANHFPKLLPALAHRVPPILDLVPATGTPPPPPTSPQAVLAVESLGVRPGYAARFDSLAMSAGWVWGLGWMKVQVQVGVRCVCGTVVIG